MSKHTTTARRVHPNAPMSYTTDVRVRDTALMAQVSVESWRGHGIPAYQPAPPNPPSDNEEENPEDEDPEDPAPVYEGEGKSHV